MAVAPAPASPLPEHFDRYSLLGHLATGGMAELYLARQGGMRGFEKLVVIKRMRPELAHEEGAVEAFLDEARLVATLEHPGIVQVHEIGLVAGSYYFVMEHVDGVDLRQLLAACLGRGERLPLAEALHIAIDACSALHYAHTKLGPGERPLGIIHRDLSPSNLLISHEGAVKVCDFGIAKSTAGRGDTERGMVKGKFSYMSPEQCVGASLDHRSDVFALGILLYEMTTGRQLFQGESPYAVMCSIVEEPVLPPSVHVLDYPLELEHIVMRALAPDRADRYPSARALGAALEGFARAHGLAASPAGLAALMGRLFDQRRDTARIFARGSACQPVARPPIPPGVSLDEPTHVSPPAGALLREPRAATRPARPARPARRAGQHLGWLVAAVMAALLAAGATLAAGRIADAGRQASRAALQADAERIATAVDAAARRAALEGPVHVEARAGALVAVADVAGAPAVQVELDAVRPSLARYAARAALAVGGAELVLLDGDGPAPIAERVTTRGGDLSLIVSPAAAALPGWFAPARAAAIGLAALLLLGLLAAPRRPAGGDARPHAG